MDNHHEVILAAFAITFMFAPPALADEAHDNAVNVAALVAAYQLKCMDFGQLNTVGMSRILAMTSQPQITKPEISAKVDDLMDKMSDPSIRSYLCKTTRDMVEKLK